MCVCKWQPHNDTMVRKQATKQGEAEGLVQVSGQLLPQLLTRTAITKAHARRLYMQVSPWSPSLLRYLTT
jgi:hypothetical protein